MAIVFKDFGTAYLAAPLAVGGLTITVDSPSSFPVLQAGDYFYLVLQKYSDRSYVEIVKVTATAGSTYTIQRGQAGTVARTFALGDYAELRLTVDALSEFIAQGIATKMDKSGGGDFTGLYRFLASNTPRIDVARTSDGVASSVALDFSASEGHRAIIGGPVGANVTTPNILLRPNGYSNGTGQVKIDKDGLVDAVALVMRGTVQRTEAGAAVRYDELDKLVPKTRTVNGHDFTSDFSLTAADVGAIPVNSVDGTPVAAYYRVATPNSVGTKIKLPFKMSHNKMVAFTVRVYQNYHIVDIQFSGYLFSNGNQWYNPRATMIAGSKSISVAMGREVDNTAYVWVEGADYSGVAVFDVVAGFTGGDWNSGWVITSDDNKPNIKYEDRLYPPYSPNNKPVIADVTGLSDALLQAGGKPVLSADWVQLRSAMWNGFVAADGQTLNRADHPDAWAAIAAGKVPVVADADWLADPSKRGSFTAGNGTTTFRVPDYNGKSGGSLGAVFMRGDGLNSAGVSGLMQGDAIRNITGSIETHNPIVEWGGEVTNAGSLVLSKTKDLGASNFSSPAANGYNKISIDASRAVPVAADNHPVNVTGCWAIKLFGAVQNEGSIDAATLATAVAGLASRVSVVEGKVAVLEQRKSTCLVNAVGTGASHETVVSQLPASVLADRRYVLPNPFGINIRVSAVLELYVNGRWAEPKMDGISGYGVAAYGAYATYVQGEGIVVQTGSAAVIVMSNQTGGGHGYTGATLTSAPCRVFVRKLDD